MTVYSCLLMMMRSEAKPSFQHSQFRRRSSLKCCFSSLILIALPLFALLQPSAEMKAERSGAFISADGCKNSFNFNTFWL